jgi:hypothetical protein
MTAPRRYAEGTKVTVDSSRGDITGILAKHGVVKMGWSSDPEKDQLVFEMEGGTYRLTMLKPTLAEIRRAYPNAYDEQAKIDGEWRRRWRANVLLLKAKLEFADGETTSITRELLPFRVLKGGKTVEEMLINGGLPLLEAGVKP